MKRISTVLALGLLVVITPLTTLGATYTVRPGDTLGVIAGNYNTTVTELVRLNNLSNPNLINVGQTLRVAENQIPIPLSEAIPWG